MIDANFRRIERNETANPKSKFQNQSSLPFHNNRIVLPQIVNLLLLAFPAFKHEIIGPQIRFHCLEGRQLRFVGSGHAHIVNPPEGFHGSVPLVQGQVEHDFRKKLAESSCRPFERSFIEPVSQRTKFAELRNIVGFLQLSDIGIRVSGLFIAGKGKVDLLEGA